VPSPIFRAGLKSVVLRVLARVVQSDYTGTIFDMNTNLIRERLHRDTKPFVFRLSDGSRVPVAHPDFAAVTPGLIVVIGKKYSVMNIDPLHVVAIEELPPKKSKSNGKRAH
jgi:hypothetical protein